MGTDRFEGKVAVVTGGASGIGKATVLRFLDEGASVVAADFNAESGAALMAEADDKRLRFVRADVSAEADVEAVVASAVEEFGRLDVWCNNAGVGGAFGSIADITVDDWDYTVAVLLRSVFLGTKHAVRAFRAQGGGGAIVNTASVAGLRAGAGPQAYSACKAGVVNFTRATALELAPEWVRVNCVCPGGINTPLLNFGNAEAVGQVLDTIQPWPRHGRPEDIAAAICFLASDDASFITGEALVVDGGLTITGSTGSSGRTLGGGALPAGASGVSKGSTGELPTIRMGS
jgi:NAD(P)-dependent dehydrogenase (short-subunit alcohol dehydrogenase family)